MVTKISIRAAFWLSYPLVLILIMELHYPCVVQNAIEKLRRLTELTEKQCFRSFSFHPMIEERTDIISNKHNHSLAY